MPVNEEGGDEQLSALAFKIVSELHRSEDGAAKERSILVLLGGDPDSNEPSEGADAVQPDDAGRREPVEDELAEALGELADAIYQRPDALAVARLLLTDVNTPNGRRESHSEAIKGDPFAERPSVFYYATDAIADYMVSRGMSLLEASAITEFMASDPSEFDFKLMSFAGQMYEYIYNADLVANDPSLAQADPKLSPESFDNTRRRLLEHVASYVGYRAGYDARNPLPPDRDASYFKSDDPDED